MSINTAAPTPNSPFPTPSLPPTARDFEIHRLALVELLSTRRIAEKFDISQTRVRQIIARVADWMTEMLPIKSEQDIEKEKNYAIHLAAAQLQNQIEHLKYSWDASLDPKYQRQMTRTIIALARLGVSSHHLDALADRGAGLWPAESSDLPSSETLARRASEGTGSEPALHSPALSPIPNPKSEIPNSSVAPSAPVPCSPVPRPLFRPSPRLGTAHLVYV